MWNYSIGEEKAVNISVHLFGSATIKIPTPRGDVKLTQKSDWPWSGEVEFELNTPQDILVSIAIRIPSWAKSWKVSKDSN
jgi:uncharacterized protein